MDGRRVVVTGVGVVSAVGIGAEAFWAGPARPGPGGQDPGDPGLGPRPLVRRAQGRPAGRPLRPARRRRRRPGPRPVGRPGGDPDRIGVLVGTGIGGLHTLEDQVEVHREPGPRRVSPFLIPMLMPNAAAAGVSMRYGFRGPCETTVTACAAGTHSIGNAARLIATGRCDAVVTGGTESAITPTGVAGFDQHDRPVSSSGVSRPFDRDRDGFVMAEGAGVLVLEELEHARARGATILAEVLGSASTADAHHITAPVARRVGRGDLHGAGPGRRRPSARDGASRSTPTAPRRRSTTPPRPRPSSRCSGPRARRSPRSRASPATASAPPARWRRPPSCSRCSTGSSRPRPTTCRPRPTSRPIDVVTGEAREWEPGPDAVELLRLRRPQRLRRLRRPAGRLALGQL